jgi:hypothetical protein
MTLRVAVALMFAQAVSLALLAVFLVAALGRTDSGRLALRAILPFEVLASIVVIVLVLLGWQLVRRRRWARGPALALELLFVPVTYYLVGLRLPGIVVIASALACVGLLIAPASRAALGIRS